jgi:Tol biopolymer transport system component
MTSFPGTRRPVKDRAAALAVTLAAVAALVALPAAGQYFTAFGKNRIQYRDFDWQIYHSPHFDVYYYTAEEHLLQKLVSIAESAYDELSRTFDHQIQEPTPLIVYSTHSAFQQNNIILYGVPEGAQAFATPSRFRMVLPLDMPDVQLLALVKHELTHIFQYHILFRGRLGAGLRSSPPQWFMEGMASYFADDEVAADKKYMVDAVVNDNIPSVETLGGGFFAYRYGHAVFDYIEERWGQDAVLDLIYEYRNTIGSRIGRAIERTFRMDVEDFDAEFRRWARQKYLPELIATGEPGDFGKPFRLNRNTQGGQELAPDASPSGDLVASLTTDRGEVDISLFDTKNRRRIKNLTKGLDTDIRGITVGNNREVGGDLAFSPDGNYIAAFGRREAGRALLLIDVLHGGIDKIIEMEIEQQRSPEWTPDGRMVAFSGNLGGQFDIFAIDVSTLEILNLTNDENFDAAPAFSPDGRWLTYTSWVGGYAQIFRADMNDLSQRYQLTSGEHNNKEPVYSPSGRRLYYTSDKSGTDNIYGLDLDQEQVTQYTNAITGCDRPTVLPLPEGGERLVYNGFWKGRFDLYMTDVEEPLGEPEPVEIAEGPTEMATLERFEPDIEVAIDDSNKEDYGGFKFFLEDVQNFIGVDSNQIFIGRVVLHFSDYLGDRRFITDLAAVDSVSDFNVVYLNQRKRRQWSARVFDTRVYRFFQNPFDPFDYSRDEIYSITGGEYSMIFPLSFKNRFSITGGYYLRSYKGFFNEQDSDGNIVPVIFPRDDDYPQIGAAFVSDSTIYDNFGPISGHRLRLDGAYAYDTSDSGTLFTTLRLDARKYVPVTRRMNFAFRFFGYDSQGNFPNATFIGGLDTIRGVRLQSLGGFRAFFANAELRFPLIDALVFPGFGIQGIRGVVFFDIGSAWFPGVTDFDLLDDDNRIDDGFSSYGFGITANLFGLRVNWDFSKVWDLKDSFGSFETEFWIGTRF